MGDSFLRGERRQISSSKALDGVTSPEGSNVKPETCRSKVLAEEHDLVEVTTDINNHAKANKICEHPFLFNIIQGDLDQGLIAYSL